MRVDTNQRHNISEIHNARLYQSMNFLNDPHNLNNNYYFESVYINNYVSK